MSEFTVAIRYVPVSIPDYFVVRPRNFKIIIITCSYACTDFW